MNRKRRSEDSGRRGNVKWQSGRKPGKSRFTLWKLLNPRNLQKEVHVYGYHFSWKTHTLVLFLSIVGMLSIGVLFQIKLTGMAVLGAAVVVLLPVLILDMYKRMYEHRRFSDVAVYLEQMIYSFQKNGKILASLREASDCFGQGTMKRVIGEAIAYIQQGQTRTERGLYAEALEKIERVYPCQKMGMVHEVLLSAEDYGGEVEHSLFLVMEDLEVWKRRIYQLQKEKKQTHTDNILSILMATLLCAVALYVIDDMKVLFEADSVMNVLKNGIVQITSVAFILGNMYVFTKSSRALTKDWLEEEYTQEDLLEREYRDIAGYDERKERRFSLMLAVPCLVLAVPVFFLFRKWAGVLLLAAGSFFLVQHKIGIAIAKKDVLNAMYVAFPQWLMDLALLLQNNNVQMSIEKSMRNAPSVLRAEIGALLERIRKEPDRLGSYTEFCKEFDIPEAQSCMKMLYAISESGAGNAEEQLHNLQKHIYEMQEKADRITDEQKNFRMQLIFNYPAGMAAAKMLVDMTVGMVVMFQIFRGIGG